MRAAGCPRRSASQVLIPPPLVSPPTPHPQGRIACCNVLSDLYAMGISSVDTMLMLLGVSSDMPAELRDPVTRELMRGFSDCAASAGTSCTGGQTVVNPWPIVGGVASVVAGEAEFVRPGGLRPGDVLVLTKPLGTQLAVNMWQRRDDPEKWARVAGVLSREGAARAYDAACAGMARLNAAAARLMAPHAARGCTDVTGFGVLGHARNLAAHAQAPVRIVLSALPCIAGMLAADAALGSPWRLAGGLSAETSGGLLIALPPERVAGFCAAFAAASGGPAWVVGRVEAAPGGERLPEAQAAVLAPEGELQLMEVEVQAPSLYDEHGVCRRA